MGATPTVARVIALGTLLLGISSTSLGQQLGGIAGVVKDTSGAVLPGVTVEAASPVLIEKVRAVVTDDGGQYKIVDLRPGTYSVTFALPGFSTARREGVELTGGFTATVNADLKVGGLEETITVSGGSPLVDTQNVVAQSVVSSELISALPSSTKALVTLVNIIPGMTGTADVGGASGIYTSNATYKNSYHGKGGVKFLYDGMNALNMNAGATSYIINSATVEESTVQTSGANAESTASGVLINLIPKEGGNALKGLASGFFTNDNLQSNNLDAALNARGLTTTNKVLHLYDANFTLGGPIKRDQLWFFVASRGAGNREQVPGVYFNKTLGGPLYTPDLSRPSYRDEKLWGQAERVTWQISKRNKLNVFADTQGLFILGRGDFTAPEAGTAYNFWPDGLYQVTWNSPVTSKLLLEAGTSMMRGPYPFPSPGKGIMRVSPTNISTTDLLTGFIYNARPSYATVWDNTRIVQRFSSAYVTGSHAIKAGIQIEEGISNNSTEIQQDVTYQFLGSRASRITQFATPYLQKERMMPDLGLFAQDQWTLRHLTLNYGLRFNWFHGYVPEQSVPAGQFVGARSFARVDDVPNWKDLNPRVGAAYDLFANGRTALKFSLGRYNNVTATSFQRANNPITTSVNSVTRTWDDSIANYVPDCDLKNPLANGECGQISNLNFGGLSATTRYADDVKQGWGVRNYLWDLSAEVQHQLTPRISITGGLLPQLGRKLQRFR